MISIDSDSILECSKFPKYTAHIIIYYFFVDIIAYFIQLEFILIYFQYKNTTIIILKSTFLISYTTILIQINESIFLTCTLYIFMEP